MKKCFSNIRTLAALLMAGAAFAACSSDDNSIEQSANPTAPKTYTLTINASKGDASTRALALNGTKLVAKWADGDELYVYKATNRAECTSDNKLGTISTVASAISADGDQATFTGTLSGTVTVSTDDKLMLVYHPAAFDITGFEGQDGTLASASALDCATALVTASVSGSDITINHVHDPYGHAETHAHHQRNHHDQSNIIEDVYVVRVYNSQRVHLHSNGCDL